MTETVLEHWNKLVAAAPPATALTESANDRTWTRAELDTEATNWLASLDSVLAQNLPGQRVTFAITNSAQWFAVFIGLIRAGAVPVPLDPSEPAATQRQLALSAGASFALIRTQLEPLGQPHTSDGSTVGAALVAGPFEAEDTRKKSARVSPKDSEVRPQGPPLHSIQNSRTGAPHVLVKLTSGSTGTPRALAFTDAQMIADGRNVCATMRITPDDINFAVIPFGHSYGLGNLVMPLLIQGTAIVCSSVPLPHALAADIAHWKPTVFPAVPALLRVLSEADLPTAPVAPNVAASASEWPLKSLRTVISAGTPLSPEIAQAFFNKFNLRPHGFYGSSETGGITYDRTGEATLTGRSVGTPLEGVTISTASRSIRSSRSDRIASTPKAGGPSRASRIRVTSAAVHGRGSFSPADRATFNEHGELVLQGRTGRLVKIAGRRLDLADLERVLRALPDIRDAFAATHPQNPEELAAVLATSLDLATARTLLRRELAPWKVPRRLVVVADFPLTARGKPDQAALKQLLVR